MKSDKAYLSEVLALLKEFEEERATRLDVDVHGSLATLDEALTSIVNIIEILTEVSATEAAA